MSGFRTFEQARVVLSNGRPKAPLVDISLVRPANKPTTAKAWTQPEVKQQGFIPPKAATPKQFENMPTNRMRWLLDVVATGTGVSVEEIISHRRRAPQVKARQIAFWIARHFTKLSTPQIGHRVGRRDHTTAIHGIRKAQSVIDRLNVQVVDCPVTMTDRLWAADWSRQV